MSDSESPDANAPGTKDVADAPTPDRDTDTDNDNEESSLFSLLPNSLPIESAGLVAALKSTESAPSTDKIQSTLGVSKPVARLARAGVKAAKSVGIEDVESAVGDGELPAYIEMGLAGIEMAAQKRGIELDNLKDMADSGGDGE